MQVLYFMFLTVINKTNLKGANENELYQLPTYVKTVRHILIKKFEHLWGRQLCAFPYMI